MARRIPSILKTLYFRAKTGNANIAVYPQTRFRIVRGARLQVTGALRVGCQWPEGRYFPSQAIVKRGGVWKVKGRFKIYTNFNLWVDERAELVLGSGFINNGLDLQCFQEIRIGDDVSIGPNVTIRDSDNHSLNGNRSTSGPVLIGNHVWIGMGVTILKGVTVGDGAAVAACSVVTKDVRPRTLVAGVPARVKRSEITWD